MAFFQLMLKANRLDKARLAYQDEKLRSIEISRGAKVHYTLSQKIRRKKIMCKRKLRSCWKKCTSCPKDSWFHKKSVLLKAEGSFENFILKSVAGFLGGIFLTYMFFMFFIFQLNFTLSSATMLCSFFGIILTIGLAFSYRVRCVVFLLLPQIFSKRGRQALMAYAFILTLTGPAKNTLHNTGVLSESLACGQEQLKQAVKAIVDLVKRPFYALRDALSRVIKTIKIVVNKIKQAMLAIKRMVLSILRVIKAVFQWLGSVVNICNKKLGTPFDRCQRVFDGAVADCYAKLGPIFGTVCNLAYVAGAVCYVVKPLDFICMLVSYISDNIVGAVRRKIRKFTKRIEAMFYVKIKFSHSFHFETNKSQSFGDISTGIATEIRSRTDRFLTVFDWMGFVTSFFVLFMLLRVIYYRQKWLTNERFDNRYITNDIRHIDLIRAKNDKETVLPLNPRERDKYIPLTSITLIKVEKIQLTKSAVFLFLTTFKLCIHMMADYSLYWVLSTIRYHGRFETKVQQGDTVNVHVSGDGYLAELYRSIARAFSPYGTDTEVDTVPCLPDPMPPDLDRYIQIVSLIAFSWIMAIFEPYGLRLRQVVMTYYYPQRAQQRAVWLYNHIIRSRGSFLKYARRQLRRKFGMNDGKPVEQVTCKERMVAILPCLRYCIKTDERNCLLCGAVERENGPPFVKCPTPGCIGLFCTQCFADLQNTCTICLAPMDYGDLTDMSEEKDSSEDQFPVIRKKVKKVVPEVEEISKDEGFTSDEGSTRDEGSTLAEGSTREELEKETEETTATSPKLSRDESPLVEEETGGVSSSTEYSQSYQDEEPEKLDITKQDRIRYKDVEAQKQHDDVTIQIFNEPLRGDATSGDESPTSCFVVRAHRRLRSRLKRKCRSCPSRDCSSSSSASSIADTESMSTDEIEEDEIIHVEIEDDYGRGDLGAGGSKILTKKRGRIEKIVAALGRVSWINKNSEKKRDCREICGRLDTRRPSLMCKVRDMIQAGDSGKPIRAYKDARGSQSDGEQFEEHRRCSSSSSESSFEQDYEKCLLLPKRNDCDAARDKSKRERNRESSSRKKPRYCRDHADDYIYETSWESHRQCGGGDTPRFSPRLKNEKALYAKRVNALSNGTKYSEINEINLNKLSNGKSSSETGRTEESWNITETEDKQGTNSDYSYSSKGNNARANSVGMSTIEEDSKEFSSTDNRTNESDRKYAKGRGNYVDATGFSSAASDTTPGNSPKRKRPTEYVTKDEMEAATSKGRKRARKVRRRRREESYDAPVLQDPLAGLEIYGVSDRRKKRLKRSWIEEETVEDESEELEEVVETHDEEKSEPQKESEPHDTSAEETQTEPTKEESETSGTEIRTSDVKEPSEENAGNYQEHRVTLRRSKKDKCKSGKRRSETSKRHREKDKRKCKSICDKRSRQTSAQDGTGKSCGIKVQPEEWFYQEQRKLWEEMCAKMAEYSHRSACPKKSCRPAPYFPHDGCTIPMYNPNLFRPPIQAHSCPRFPRGTTNGERSRRPIPPVLRRFLPKYQQPAIIEELKSRDRARLTRERNERKRRCEQGQGPTMEDQPGTSGRNVLSRPSIIPECTDVLAYQETESFKNLLNEYKAIAIPKRIEEASGEEDEDEDIGDDREPLISSSKNAKKCKKLKQLFPPETKRRSSAIAQIGNRIACVFKGDTWRSRKNAAADGKIADSDSWSEMSIVEDKERRKSCRVTSPVTTDNNETTE